MADQPAGTMFTKKADCCRSLLLQLLVPVCHVRVLEYSCEALKSLCIHVLAFAWKVCGTLLCLCGHAVCARSE